MNPKELSILGMAQMAEALKPQMIPIINGLEEAILSELKGKQRAGEFDHATAIAGMAKLVVLEDLKNSLDSMVRRASKIREEKLNDGI